MKKQTADDTVSPVVSTVKLLGGAVEKKTKLHTKKDTKLPGECKLSN